MQLDTELARLGLSGDDAQALFLVPAALVAWADGHVDMKELETLASRHRPADCQGAMVCLSDRGRQFLYHHFIYVKPDHETITNTLRLVSAMLDLLPEDRAQRYREAIAAMCVDVARSSGSGLLSFFTKISADERAVIRQVAVILRLLDNAEIAQLLGGSGA